MVTLSHRKQRSRMALVTTACAYQSCIPFFAQLVQRHVRREDVRRQYHFQKRSLKQRRTLRPTASPKLYNVHAYSSDEKSEVKSDSESVASHSSLFRGRLVAFYNQWRPSKLETPGFVDNVLREYEGLYRYAQFFPLPQSQFRSLI